jgi:phosphoribosylaminoimidazolecarboxamide formyltransferase/IMP cyclohydrolase
MTNKDVHLATDPTSAFGGVIAVNGEVSVELAEQIAEIFTEVVLAPGYADGAVEVLARKKNVRVLRLPTDPARTGAEMRSITASRATMRLSS